MVFLQQISFETRFRVDTVTPRSPPNAAPTNQRGLGSKTHAERFAMPSRPTRSDSSWKLQIR